MKKLLQHYFPNLKESWLLILILTLGGSLLGVVLSLLVALISPQHAQGAAMLSYPFIFIPPFIYIYFRGRKIGGATSLPLESPNFGKIGAVTSFAMLFPLVFAFNYVIEPLFFWMEIPNFMVELLDTIHKYRVSSFLSVVIFAPLLEELFCRGIILRGALKHTTPVKAIFWSAVMFGIMHLNPWQALPAFFIGVLIGWIYWKSHSLWSAIFIHFVNNGFSYLITLLNPHLAADAGFKDIMPQNLYLPIYVVSLLYVIVSIYLMNKYYDKPISYEVFAHTKGESMGRQ